MTKNKTIETQKSVPGYKYESGGKVMHPLQELHPEQMQLLYSLDLSSTKGKNCCRNWESTKLMEAGQ